LSGGVSFVDHQDLVIEAGSIFRVLPAIDPDVGADGVFRLDVPPPGAEGGTIGGHALADNRDESPAVGESP